MLGKTSCVMIEDRKRRDSIFTFVGILQEIDRVLK